MSKDCANKTAINSLYNRFSSGGWHGEAQFAVTNPLLALTGNGRPVAYELSYPKQCKGASNGRHQSDWMSAVADAAATGVPLFVPVPSPTRTNSDQAKQTLGRLGDLSSPSVEIEDHRRLHETGLMTTVRRQTGIMINTNSAINPSTLFLLADAQRPQWHTLNGDCKKALH